MMNVMLLDSAEYGLRNSQEMSGIMKKFKSGLASLVVVTVITTAGCAKSPSAPVTAASDPEGYKLFLEARTQDELKKKLRDPESAVFSDVHFGKLVAEGYQVVVVCGRVNSRNGFGGMTGPQRFVGVAEAVFLEEEGASAVAEVWASSGC